MAQRKEERRRNNGPISSLFDAVPGHCGVRRLSDIFSRW